MAIFSGVMYAKIKLSQQPQNDNKKGATKIKILYNKRKSLCTGGTRSDNSNGDQTYHHLLL